MHIVHGLNEMLERNLEIACECDYDPGVPLKTDPSGDHRCVRSVGDYHDNTSTANEQHWDRWWQRVTLGSLVNNNPGKMLARCSSTNMILRGAIVVVVVLAVAPFVAVAVAPVVACVDRDLDNKRC